jgi:hypothetical protein
LNLSRIIDTEHVDEFSSILNVENFLGIFILHFA